ncbi:DUF969 family protein, partial [Staphylococcus pseudintermedius]|uniref:5-oxoproline transporter, DUF969 family subunit n=1 Tax=Staphylococcus pseudintermedius TaxID=283734 RepID=UPI000E37323D
IQGITSGRIMSVYLFMRDDSGLASIRIGGLPQFVRPLMNRFVHAAAKATSKQKVDPVDED